MLQPHVARQGYVLAGGRSRRMGEDKALLPFGGRPLGSWMAERVRQVCGEAAILGDPGKYAAWGFPVIRDVFAGSGPLGGIHAGLVHSDAELNLVVGCDMPFLSSEFLEWLLCIAAETEADAVVPESKKFEYEPLCGVYKPACLAPMERALRVGRRKVSEVFDWLRLRAVSPAEWQDYDPQDRLFRNLNTREEYELACRELLLAGDCR